MAEISDEETERNQEPSYLNILLLQQLLQLRSSRLNNININSNNDIKSDDDLDDDLDDTNDDDNEFDTEYYYSIPKKNNLNINNIIYPTNDDNIKCNSNSLYNNNNESLQIKLQKEGNELSRIISTLYSDINIPWFICSEMILYTYALIPGCYYFIGKMGSGYYEQNSCTCRIALDEYGQITGGFFQELYNDNYNSNNGFKYEITHGTYDYKHGLLEFTKWYFPFNYRYKVFGRIGYGMESNDDDKKDIDMIFHGTWERTGYNRSGAFKMSLTNNNVTLDQQIEPGKYVLFCCTEFGDTTKDENGEIYANKKRMELHIELHKFNKISGYIVVYKGGVYINEWNGWRNSYRYKYPDEFDDIECKLNIINGKWHNFGKIIIALDNGKMMKGFFNSKCYIGEWLRFDNKIFNMYINDNNNNKNNNISDEQLKDKYKEISKIKLGYFEFEIMNENDDTNNNDVSTDTPNNDTNINSNNNDNNGNKFSRQLSLDSDDNNDDDINMINDDNDELNDIDYESKMIDIE